MTRESRYVAAGLVLTLVLGATAYAQSAEKLVASSMDVRTTLTFKVPDAAVRKVLPEGWELNSPTTGPNKGFNVSVVLIDQQFAQDADGKDTPLFRGAVVAIPAKKSGSDTTGSMIITGLAAPSGSPGAYGVYMELAFAIDRMISTGSDKSASEERWAFKANDGNTIDVQISYIRSAPTRSKPTDFRIYSSARPDFYRIYRQEQATDFLRNADGTDRITKLSFKAAGPKLSQLFDGSEQLVNVISIPWYARQTFLPGS